MRVALQPRQRPLKAGTARAGSNPSTPVGEPHWPRYSNHPHPQPPEPRTTQRPTARASSPLVPATPRTPHRPPHHHSASHPPFLPHPDRPSPHPLSVPYLPTVRPRCARASGAPRHLLQAPPVCLKITNARLTAASLVVLASRIIFLYTSPMSLAFARHMSPERRSCWPPSVRPPPAEAAALGPCLAADRRPPRRRDAAGGGGRAGWPGRADGGGAAGARGVPGAGGRGRGAARRAARGHGGGW